jgi:hypothetical protein
LLENTALVEKPALLEKTLEKNQLYLKKTALLE